MEEQGIENGCLPIEQILSAAEVCDFEYGRAMGGGGPASVNLFHHPGSSLCLPFYFGERPTRPMGKRIDWMALAGMLTGAWRWPTWIA